MPKVYAALLTVKDWQKGLQAYRDREVDGLELRLDALRALELPKLLRKISETRNRPPLLITVRSKQEGGIRMLSDEERLARFRLFIPFANSLDCEISSTKILPVMKLLAKKHHKDFILSYHNFKMTPPLSKLEKVLKTSLKHKPALTKLALFINRTQDLIRLLVFLKKHHKKGIVIIGMGEKGRVSRILFPAMDSKITYGHLGRKSAPGQIAVRILSEQVRKLLSVER